MNKSEIIVQDFGGHHNKNGALTKARLLKGGSWRKQNIIVILPADKMIPAKVALSLWNLIFPPNQSVVRLLTESCEVGHAYSVCLEQVLAHPQLSTFQYVLCVEHDNLPPQDGVLMLLEDLEEHPELSAVSGLYFCKGENGCSMIWGDPTDPSGLNYRPQIPRENTLQECCGIGQGFALFRLQMFKDQRLQRPWFRTLASKDGVGTQDLALWSDARKFGHRCAVDTRVKVGHMDSTGFVW